MPSPPFDLEQIIFDALSRQIDAANDLVTAPDAPARLLEVAVHCEAAAQIARTAQMLLDRESDL